MTLTINPESTLRPLGEEHLRMFRRMVGPADATPKIALPKAAVNPDGVFLLREKVMQLQDTSPKAQDIAKSHNARLATLLEVLMNKLVLVEARSREEGFDAGVIFVDWIGIPQKPGWYYINRETQRLEPISKEKAEQLAWCDKIEFKDFLFGAIKAGEAMPIIIRSDAMIPIWDAIRGHVALFREPVPEEARP